MPMSHFFLTFAPRKPNTIKSLCNNYSEKDII